MQTRLNVFFLQCRLNYQCLRLSLSSVPLRIIDALCLYSVLLCIILYRDISKFNGVRNAGHKNKGQKIMFSCSNCIFTMFITKTTSRHGKIKVKFNFKFSYDININIGDILTELLIKLRRLFFFKQRWLNYNFGRCKR